HFIPPLILDYTIQFIQQNTQIHYQKTHHIILTHPQSASIIIHQLLNNPLKYPKPKHISIHFHLPNQTLHIKHNPIPITKPHIPKIFHKPYSPFNPTFNQQSTPIPLFILQHIPNHLNIQLTLQSHFNHRTLFFIHFTKQK
ncbi:ATP-binding protein, partial [Staphylococcus epidermidis]